MKLKNKKPSAQCWAGFGPRTRHCWPGPQANLAHGGWSGMRDMHRAHGHHGQRAHAGATRSGSSMIGPALLVHDKHHGSTCRPPSNEDRTGSQQRRRAVGRRWSLVARLLPAGDELPR
jgi:hypothetical protein